MKGTAGLAGGILICAAMAIAGAQTLVVDVNLTGLAVRVYDIHRTPVLNLKPEDFEIFENGQPRPLASFSIDSQPAALGLLVDRSISVGTVKKSIERTVIQAVQSLNPAFHPRHKWKSRSQPIILLSFPPFGG